MSNRFNPFAGLSKQIEVLAEDIDLASIPSKADEMHRLLDDACNALIAVLAFSQKIGVTTLDDQHTMFALDSMLRDENGKRSDVDNLDLVNATRLAYANQLGVSEQAVIRFEKMGAAAGGFGRFVNLNCNHPGCSMSKGVDFNNPAEMLEAEQRASKEIWYCQHHREIAFSNEGTLSDELLPVLQLIAQSPGLTQKAAGAKRGDIAFLEIVGLVRVDHLNHGNRVLCYQIFLTEAGQGVLDKYLSSD